jgi:hypothetical protein
MLIVILFFTTHTLISYIKYRHKAALFLALNYFSYVVALTLYFFGHLSVVLTSQLQFHHNVAMLANFFIVLGMVMALLFYDQFSKLKKNIKIVATVAGVFIMVWILLPFNYNVVTPEESPIILSTYMIMTTYGFVIYISLTVLFYKTYLKMKGNRRALASLVIGNFLWVVIFTIRTIYGITQIDMLEIVGNAIMLFVFVFFFFGLFYFPKTKRE